MLEEVVLQKCGFHALNSRPRSDTGTHHSMFDVLNSIETLKEVSLEQIRISSTVHGDVHYGVNSSGYYHVAGLTRLCQNRMNQSDDNNNANDFQLRVSDAELSRTALEGILETNSRVTHLDLLGITNINDNMEMLQNCLRQNSTLESFQLKIK